MSGSRKALGGLDINSSAAADRDGGDLHDLSGVAASLKAIDIGEGASKVTPKKRRIEAGKENVTTPGRSFGSGARGLSNMSTPVQTPNRDGDDLNRSVSSAGKSRDFGRTPPRSATRVLNTSSFSTPGSSTKRKVEDVFRGDDHDPHHSQSSPKDMYPPDGEKAEEDASPRSTTDMQSSLMDRLRSIEENLTNLNKQEVAQELLSPYIPLNANSGSKPASSSSSKKKDKPVSFMEPAPSRPKPAAKMVNKALRQSMATTKASIEGDKRKVASPLKGARPRPMSIFPSSSSEGSDSAEDTSPRSLSSVSAPAMGKEELDEEEAENVDPNVTGAPGGRRERGTENEARGKGGDGVDAAAAAAKEESGPNNQRPAKPPVNSMSHLEFRNHVLTARVAASHTLLRSKDKSQQQAGHSFIGQQLEHYRALNRQGVAEGGRGKDRSSGGHGVVVTERELVEPSNSEPQAPLGDQGGSNGCPVPLTSMSLLQEKLSSWKGKYTPPDDEEGEAVVGGGQEQAGASLGAHLEVLRSAEKASKPGEEEGDDDDFSI